jgi:hypothetical protein
MNGMGYGSGVAVAVCYDIGDRIIPDCTGINLAFCFNNSVA